MANQFIIADQRRGGLIPSDTFAWNGGTGPKPVWSSIIAAWPAPIRVSNKQWWAICDHPPAGIPVLSFARDLMLQSGFPMRKVP